MDDFPPPPKPLTPTPMNVPAEWSLDDAPPAQPHAAQVLPPDENTIRSARDLAEAAEAGATSLGGRRGLASRIRQNLDDMTSSVREMEAFLQTATATPPGAEAPADGGRRKGRKGRPAKGQGGAAQPPQKRGRKPRGAAQQPPAPPMQPAPVPPSAPDFSAATAPAPVAPAAPAAPSAPPVGAVPAAPPRPPAAELAAIRVADLQALSADDLLGLAREQDVLGSGGARRRQDLVFALLVKHARRGGAVEGEGRLSLLPPSHEAPGPEGAPPPRGGFRSGPPCFLRAPANGFRASPADVAVPAELRERNALRPGDHVVCRTRFVPQGPAGGYFEATALISVNGLSPDRARQTPFFDALPAEPPSRRIAIRSAAVPDPLLDALDALAPLAFGQRGLLLAPRGTDPSPLLRALARAAAANHPSAKVVVLAPAALPERLGADAAPPAPFPTYATDFDDPPERHVRLVVEALESARRDAENGLDVVLLVDGLDAVLNLPGALLAAPPAFGRRGGHDDAGLVAARRLFAAGRALRGAGSLTVLATARVPSPARPMPALDALDDALVEMLRPALSWTAALDADGLVPAATRSLGAERFAPREEIGRADALRASLPPSATPETRAAVLKRLVSALPPAPPPPEAPALFQPPA